MKEEYLTLFNDVNSAYGDVLLQTKELWGDVSQDESLNECADKVYALRETIKVLEQTTKEVKKLFQFAEKTACMVEIKGEQDEARTEYCTGHSEIKQIVSCPSKRRYDPENFDKLMEYLGIPVQLYRRKEGEDELVRPHWPEIQKLMNEKLEKGESIPVTVDDSNVYSFPVRKRKALTR